MYILCKEDFNKVNFNFIKGKKYPITNVEGDCCYFNYPKGETRGISSQIGIDYLEENKEYLEIVNERLCPHENTEQVYNLLICSECNELVKILK